MTEGRADVEILGQRLSVRGRGTPEYIVRLADYLNERVATVRDQARVFDPLRLSLLAGLHVVDELHRCRQAEADLVARVDELAKRLGAVLDGGRPRT
jgi:cell division protein ZapA (FtsZ GTPase activity inhibitor)